MDFQITSDEDLENAVRDKTSYNATADELPGTYDSTSGDVGGQMGGIINDAKRELYVETKSDGWYDDLAYGHALVALTAMKAKEAVENINIKSYGLGDEQIVFSNADPDSSQQIRSWSNEVNKGVSESAIKVEDSSASLSNTASYIG